MLFDGFEWWACIKGEGDLIFQGERYKKVADVPHFHGHQGQVLMGCVNYKALNLGRYKYEFIQIIDVMMLGYYVARRDVEIPMLTEEAFKDPFREKVWDHL